MLRGRTMCTPLPSVQTTQPTRGPQVVWQPTLPDAVCNRLCLISWQQGQNGNVFVEIPGASERYSREQPATFAPADNLSDSFFLNCILLLVDRSTQPGVVFEGLNLSSSSRCHRLSRNVYPALGTPTITISTEDQKGACLLDPPNTLSYTG